MSIMLRYPRRLTATFALIVATLAAACGDGPVEPSLLEQPRVVAIRAVDGAMQVGASNTLEALVFKVDTLSWRACPFPWIPPNPDLGFEELTCAFGETPIGDGNPVTFDVPPGIEELYIAIDGTAADEASTPLLTTIFRFRDDVPLAPAEPFTLTTVTDGEPDGAEPVTVPAGATLDIATVLGDSHDEGAVINWYTTGGLFEPFRTLGTKPSELTAPDTPGEITITVVLRNGDTGAAWLSKTLTVTEAEAEAGQ